MRALLKIVTSPSPALDDGAAGPPPLTYRRYALAIAVIADYALSLLTGIPPVLVPMCHVNALLVLAGGVAMYRRVSADTAPSGTMSALPLWILFAPVYLAHMVAATA